jgi:hypothetical protein
LAASDIFQSALAGGALRTFWQNMPETAARSNGVYQVTVRIEQPIIKKRLHLTHHVSEINW